MENMENSKPKTFVCVFKDKDELGIDIGDVLGIKYSIADEQNEEEYALGEISINEQINSIHWNDKVNKKNDLETVGNDTYITFVVPPKVFDQHVNALLNERLKGRNVANLCGILDDKFIQENLPENKKEKEVEKPAELYYFSSKKEIPVKEEAKDVQHIIKPVDLNRTETLKNGITDEVVPTYANEMPVMNFNNYVSYDEVKDMFHEMNRASGDVPRTR